MTEKKKGPGRPRKYADQRVKTMLWRAKQESKRVDLYLNAKAAWRLDKLAKEWECSRAGAVERLLVEADEKYRDILFPDQEGDINND
jgi:hypothetical protein